MKIEVNYTYTKDWIPPRCRKPRPGRFDGTTTVEVREVAASEAPWACVVHGHRRYFEEYPINAIRHHDGRFYERAMVDIHMKRTHWDTDSYGNRYWWCDYDTERITQRRGMTVDELVEEVGYQDCYTEHRSEREVLEHFNDKANCYLIVNGEVWREVGEPMYCIYTFGLGHNHGGSSWHVEHFYNDNISYRRYFNANDFEAMVNKFFEIALGRGDTESAHMRAEELRTGDIWNHIEVIEPSFFKRNPRVEHGEGDSFINMLNDITSKSESAAEAGLLAIATALTSH